MTLLSQGPFGAYTPTAAAAIAASLAQAGFGTTGNVFYLDPVNGLDTNDGQTPTTVAAGHGPVATLAAGYALLRSGFNDTLVLIGNGASTGSARINSFTWAKNAAHLVGICAPSALSQRARIANPTTAGITLTTPFFTITGNGCLFQNISWFHGASATQTGIAADICMTISGTRNAFINCDFEGMGDSTSATDAGSRNILLSGGGENFFYHCNIGLDTVTRTNANASVELKSDSVRNTFENCTFLFYSSDGLQYGILAAAAAALDRWVMCKGCNAINAVGSGSTAEAVFAKLAASAGGILVFDSTSGLFGFTAIGDATTKAQTYVSGGTATNGVKGVVAT
jgi:hypothetical protein